MNRFSLTRPTSMLGALAVTLTGGLMVLPSTPVVAAPVGPPAGAPSSTSTPFGPGVVELSTGVTSGQPSLAGATDAYEDSAVLGGRLFFAGSTPTSGDELWVTDGTPAGTRLVRDLVPGPGDSQPHGLTVMGDRIYFAADGVGSGIELWSTNGTPEGTARVADLNPGAVGSRPQSLTAVGARLYFVATVSGVGREVFALDAGGGPRLVADIGPAGQTGDPESLTAIADGVVFSAAVDGLRHAYVNRGTLASTQRLDVEPMNRNIRPEGFTDIGTTVVFSAGNAASGAELWRTGGQSGDAFGVKDILPGATGSNPRRFTRLGNAALFIATTAAGTELWRTDGTADGTQLVRDIDPRDLTEPYNLLRVNDTVYFQARDDLHGTELWQSRGTFASTTLAAEAAPGAESGVGIPLLGVGGRLLFAGASPATGLEPWILDQATGRSRVLQDLAPGPASSEPVSVGVLGSTVVFFATVGGQVRLFGYTASASKVRATAKKSYSATQAKKKRIKVKVKVTGETAKLRGRVTIVEGKRVVGRATVVGGAVKVRLTKRLKPGRHRLRAVYAGSIDAQASRSATLVVRVRR